MSDASTEDLRKAARKTLWATKELEKARGDVMRGALRYGALVMWANRELIMETECAIMKRQMDENDKTMEEHIEWMVWRIINKTVCFLANMSETVPDSEIDRSVMPMLRNAKLTEDLDRMRREYEMLGERFTGEFTGDEGTQ